METNPPETPPAYSEQLRQLVASLRSEYQYLYNDQYEWRNHWAQISDYFDPYSGRYLRGQNSATGFEDRGRRKDQYRLNSTPDKLMQVYQAVLAEGLIPRTRPFFKIKRGIHIHKSGRRSSE